MAERRTYTPQEQWLIDYSRESQTQGKYRVNADGSRTTILTGGIQGPDGRIYMVPMYDNATGRTLTEDEALQKWLPQIEAGMVPADTSSEAHNARALNLHRQMDADAVVMPWANSSPYVESEQPVVDSTAPGQRAVSVGSVAEFVRRRIGKLRPYRAYMGETLLK